MTTSLFLNFGYNELKCYFLVGWSYITHMALVNTVGCQLSERQLSEHFSLPNTQNIIVARADMKNCLTTPLH